MKVILLDNVLSEHELYFMYDQLINIPNWSVGAKSTDNYKEKFLTAPMLAVKESKKEPVNLALAVYGQSLVYRIGDILQKKKIGIPLMLDRMWFNITYSGERSQHWLHRDDDELHAVSILLFLTPVWQPEWRGSFYADGEEFKFKPGSAVIFNSNTWHTGEAPDSAAHFWQRLTCNIVVK